MPHQYPTRYQAQQQATRKEIPNETRKEIPNEIMEDYTLLKRLLLEIEDHKKAGDHTKSIRTAIMLFQYMEMHPQMLEYNKRLAATVHAKINEIRADGKRDVHTQNDWNNLMAVCNRVRTIAKQAAQ
jgi:hypothetical protein